jgi:DNA-binding response OmpR family regulator
MKSYNDDNSNAAYNTQCSGINVSSILEHQESLTNRNVTTKQQPPPTKRILIIDDNYDITLTLKLALETENSDNKTRFEVYTYNDCLAALFEFKPNFYDLLLIDINLRYINGFELYEKISKLDLNVNVCFMSAGEINQEAIRETHPSLSIGCFIKKPISIDELVKRVKADLE